MLNSLSGEHQFTVVKAATAVAQKFSESKPEQQQMQLQQEPDVLSEFWNHFLLPARGGSSLANQCMRRWTAKEILAAAWCTCCASEVTGSKCFCCNYYDANDLVSEEENEWRKRFELAEAAKRSQVLSDIDEHAENECCLLSAESAILGFEGH